MYTYIEAIPRSVKIAIFLIADLIFLPVCLYMAFALRNGVPTPWVQIRESFLLFPLVLGFGVIVSLALGMPRTKLSTYEVKDIGKSALFAFVMTAITISISYMADLRTPRSLPLIFGVLLFLYTSGSRLIGRAFLQFLFDHWQERKAVAIYGAGSAGIQLANALGRSKIKPVLYVDDNKSLHGLTVAGLPVYSPQKLKNFIKTGKIKSIVLAIPTTTEDQKKRINLFLGELDVDVLTLPSYNEIIAGKNLVESLRPVSLDELLGRDRVDLNLNGISEMYTGKSVFVSGAGGSIGSELCRQVLKYKLKRLVLYEHCEFALYSIDQELRPLAKKMDIELVATIGSVCDKKHVLKTMRQNATQIVLHAAAYKHVPLVECNELEGLRNNVLGTKVLADAAKQCGAERFILISTDKAVRPTSVMGASKRMAELIIQDIDSRCESTLFSMVRFGNVLGSSGSVIPVFREQIAKGGPITVTHEDVTRYFMTIPEAARLVLIAGTFSSGGEVFVLDMGKSVSIMDLAKRMIRLSGKTIRDTENPDGDIEIKITGLRPGEKLYEELLIGGDMLPTPHPKIMRAQEDSLSEVEIIKAINELNLAIINGEDSLCRSILSRWIEGYEQHPNMKSGCAPPRKMPS